MSKTVSDTAGNRRWRWTHIRRIPLFSRRGGASLVTRFQWWVFLWCTVICLASFAAAWWVTQEFIQYIATEELKKLEAEMLAVGLTDAGRPDAKSNRQLNQFMKSHPDLTAVTLFDSHWKELAQFNHGDPIVLGKQIVYIGPDTPPVMDSLCQISAVVLLPVTDLGGVTARYAVLTLSVERYQQRLFQSFRESALMISLAFFIAILLTRRMLTYALRPLTELHEPLQKLAKGEKNIEIKRCDWEDEIHAFSRTLFSTISAVQGRDEELRRLADYDSLTGLLNKRSFSMLVKQESQRVTQEKDISALFYIDLDQFKYINDTVGHSGGDRLLSQVGELLRGRMREDDSVARIGGDEYAILARSVNQKNAGEIAEDIVAALRDYVFIDSGQSFGVYCSVGVAMIDSDREAPTELLSNASIACHLAKSKGRNRYECFYSDNGTVSKLDTGWSKRIAEALTNDSFVLFFQPLQANERSWKPNFEVLLRLKESGRSLVAPGVFLPVAERFGLALEIDYWVIVNSLKELERSNREGREYRFFINLSAQVFADPPFVTRVTELLGEYDVDPTQIVFELTERAAVNNVQLVSAKMAELKTLGIRFALDDFGSGYNAYGYLKHMPVDFVKIDGEFIKRATNDEFDRALLLSMVDVARAGGKKIIAEAVADEACFSLLESMNIDYLQGYYIAEPSGDLVELAEDGVLNAGKPSA